MRGSKTPDTERAQAVGLALVKGVPAAAKALGVSQRNIRRWKQDPELAELVLSAQGELLETMRASIWVGIDQIYEGLNNPKVPLKVKAEVTFGLMDRHQLMSGGVTSRTESTLMQGRSDHEQRVLAELISGELERRADANAASVAASDSVAQPEAIEADPA